MNISAVADNPLWRIDSNKVAAELRMRPLRGAFVPLTLAISVCNDWVYRADAACFVNGLHTKAAGKMQISARLILKFLSHGLTNSVRNFDGRTWLSSG
jgi:hypothetical protein